MAVRMPAEAGRRNLFCTCAPYLAIATTAIGATIIAGALFSIATQQPVDTIIHNVSFSPRHRADSTADSPTTSVVAAIVDRGSSDGQVRVDQFELSRAIAPLKAEVIQEARADEAHSRHGLDRRVGGFSFSQETLATIGSTSAANNSLRAGATSDSAPDEAGVISVVVDSGKQALLPAEAEPASPSTGEATPR